MPQTYDEIFSASNFLADYDVHRVKNKSTGRFLSNFCGLLRKPKTFPDITFTFFLTNSAWQCWLSNGTTECKDYVI